MILKKNYIFNIKIILSNFEYMSYLIFRLKYDIEFIKEKKDRIMY